MIGRNIRITPGGFSQQFHNRDSRTYAQRKQRISQSAIKEAAESALMRRGFEPRPNEFVVTASG